MADLKQIIAPAETEDIRGKSFGILAWAIIAPLQVHAKRALREAVDPVAYLGYMNYMGMIGLPHAPDLEQATTTTGARRPSQPTLSARTADLGRSNAPFLRRL
jgi:hypothetical protein